jgi:hypothetical protein
VATLGGSATLSREDSGPAPRGKPWHGRRQSYEPPSGLPSWAEAALPPRRRDGARDGRLVYFQAVAHREDAFAELGVSEKTLGPSAA